jgi:hypothetical protein
MLKTSDFTADKYDFSLNFMVKILVYSPDLVVLYCRNSVNKNYSHCGLRGIV